MSEGKRKALETIFAKLEKLLPHLGDANPHEAAAALGKINALLASARLDWHDLMGLLNDKAPSLLDLLAKFLAKDDKILIELGLAGGEFFHTSHSASYGDVTMDGHRHTLAVAGPDFAEWLVHRFFLEMKKAPSPSALRSAIQTLSAHARYEGEQREVFLRAAHFDGKIYFDVGDSACRVVEIDATGWRIVNRFTGAISPIGGHDLITDPGTRGIDRAVGVIGEFARQQICLVR